MASLDFQLISWQQSVIKDKTRFKVVCAGRRCGKSRFAAVNLIINALGIDMARHKEAVGVLYVAPTAGMARTIMWQLLHNLAHEVIEKSNVNDGDIKLINGATIYVRGADNPDALRGMKLAYVVLDEYASMKPFVWETIIRGALTDMQGSALFIGTPAGRNHFYDVFIAGDESNEKYDDTWKSWQFTTADNELIPPEEIEAARKSLSSFAFKQEYLASFDNAGTDLFKEQWFKYGPEPRIGSWYVACDLAGFKDLAQASAKKSRLDNSAIAVVKVTDDGKWWVKKIEYGRWDIRETAVRILKNIREFRPMAIGIEKGTTYNAVMPYLSDLMRKNNVFASIQSLTHGNTAKTDRIVWALQGMFEHGRIIFNDENMNDRRGWQYELSDQLMMFPTKNVHDDCFPADTIITTLSGDKPIVEVTTDDYVATRNGFRRVMKAWCKGTKRVITRYGITATPEHRIFTTNRGWVSLDSLSDDDTIVVLQTIEETSCERPLNLTEENITAIQTRPKTTIGDTTHPTQTGKKAQGRSIEIFGSSITEKSQKDTISTMQTETGTTTTYPISYAYPVPLTKSSMQQSEVLGLAQKSILPNSTQSESLQKRGMLAKKVEHGIESMQGSRLEKTSLRSVVLSVEKLSDRKSLHKSSAGKESAQMLDKQESQERSVPVYDLTVFEDHEFFANGVLVHNCADALSYISQLSVTTYRDSEEDAGEEYEPMDVISGI